MQTIPLYQGVCGASKGPHETVIAVNKYDSSSLQVRPIHHRKQERVIAHIFCACWPIMSELPPSNPGLLGGKV